ncbi:MAG: DNA-directed RNA polymerase [archaeon]
MFYQVKLKDYIRVSPSSFSDDLNKSVILEAKKKYSGYINKDLGLVIDIIAVEDVKDGTIIPGDGATYYETVFSIITFKPEMQEILWGNIRDIADFGAFISLGPIEGMIHISQTMNDFVSFTKEKVLTGKDTKNVLKVGDIVKARIIAISYKDVLNPKLGLTMRKAGLGKDDWKESEEKPKEEKKGNDKKK